MEKPKIVVLSQNEIKDQLARTPGWVYENNKLTKEFEFNSFMDGLTFIIKLAPFCEAHDHHPDIKINYTKINFDLQRFDAGGKVTNMDFIVANQIEKLFDEYTGNKKIKNYSGIY
ncbi:MAG: 4a-hydroxytetrahydrobiopterin dehydratase [archaeon]